MENLGLYQDIANRTEGDIYVGVVRTCKNSESLLSLNVLWICLSSQTLKIIIKKKEQEMNCHKVQQAELLWPQNLNLCQMKQLRLQLATIWN